MPELTGGPVRQNGFRVFCGCIKVILGLCWGYTGVYIGFILGLYRVYIGYILVLY